MNGPAIAPALQSPAKSGFRRDIEGLRGIAVFMVVAFHCMLRGFAGGFVGVDLFFVLSGYLITGLLVAEFEKNSRINLIGFYARRVRRLLPAAALATCATVVLSILVLAPQELTNVGQATRETAVYLSNVFFARQASDYFAAGVAMNPLLHMWSLAVEEQFYLFWPLLIMLALKFGRTRKTVAIILATVALFSFASCVRLTAHHPNFSFYNLPTRAWEFAIGGLASMVPAGFFKKWQLSVLGCIGLLGIAASCIFLSGWNDFPGWIASIPVLATVASLIAGASDCWSGISFITTAKPLQWLGRLSYSWYLWHWPALVVAAALFPDLGIGGRMIAATASLGVAALSYRLVENPIRFHPRMVQSPATCFAMAAVIVAATISLGTVCLRIGTRSAMSPDMAAITKATTDIADMPRSQCVSLGSSADVKSCVFGDTSSPTTIVLFGDSHSIQWFDALQAASKKNQWKLVTFVKSHCPSVSIELPDVSSAAVEHCQQWREDAIRQITNLHPAAVVMANAAVYMDDGERGDKPRVSAAAWREGTRVTVTSLTAAQIPVVLIRDNRFGEFDIPICVARARAHGWYSEASCRLTRRNPVSRAKFAAEQAAIAGLSEVRYVDFSDDLCGTDTCPAVKRGMLVYRDDNHLAGRFAQTLSGKLGERVASVLTPNLVSVLR